jgi:hypothetical protein
VQEQTGPEGDEHDGPQAQRLGCRVAPEEVALRGERHAADRDKEHPQVQEPVPNRHCVLASRPSIVTS